MLSEVSKLYRVKVEEPRPGYYQLYIPKPPDEAVLIRAGGYAASRGSYPLFTHVELAFVLSGKYFQPPHLKHLYTSNPFVIPFVPADDALHLIRSYLNAGTNPAFTAEVRRR